LTQVKTAPAAARTLGAMRRLYFLVPDTTVGKKVVDELLLAHIEWRRRGKCRRCFRDSLVAAGPAST